MSFDSVNTGPGALLIDASREADRVQTPRLAEDRGELAAVVREAARLGLHVVLGDERFDGKDEVLPATTLPAMSTRLLSNHAPACYHVPSVGSWQQKYPEPKAQERGSKPEAQGVAPHATVHEYRDLIHTAAQVSSDIELVFVPGGAPGEVLVRQPRDGGWTLVPGGRLEAEPTHPQIVADMEAATHLATALWAEVISAGGPTGLPGPIHLEGLIDPALLASWVLPIGELRPAAQSVHLLDKDGVEQVHDEAERAHAASCRTRAYSSLEITGYGPYCLASLLLSRAAECRVVCTPYESRLGDDNLGPHWDEWVGFALQVEGLKEWQFSSPVVRRSDGSTTISDGVVKMKPGDLLLVPYGEAHAVTPTGSVHVQYAVLKDVTL